MEFDTTIIGNNEDKDKEIMGQIKDIIKAYDRLSNVFIFLM